MRQCSTNLTIWSFNVPRHTHTYFLCSGTDVFIYSSSKLYPTRGHRASPRWRGTWRKSMQTAGQHADSILKDHIPEIAVLTTSTLCTTQTDVWCIIMHSSNGRKKHYGIITQASKLSLCVLPCLFFLFFVFMLRIRF